MASLNYEQWHAWTTQMQNEHSKLTNTECCVCYGYRILNKSICGECNNYVCNECSQKLEHNVCPICRVEGIVKERQIEPTSQDEANTQQGITETIVSTITYIYNDYVNFEREFRNMSNDQNYYQPHHMSHNNNYIHYYTHPINTSSLP